MVTQTVQTTQKSAVLTSRIFKESDFKLIITRERKRSERSGRPLMLVSIDFYETGLRLEDDLMLRQAVENAVSSAVREIDFIGWLSFGREIGVLCTEITSSCHECVSERLLHKLSDKCQKGLVGKVRINCFKFPLELQNGVIKGISELESERFFPALESGRQRMNKVHRIAKRTIDIAGSLFVLFIVSPLLILVAILIKTTSRGPVLFRQERLGRNGKIFKIYKFRTMKVDNNPSAHREFVRSLISAQSKLPKSGQPAKIVNDPRITPVGKFLRQTSLDELPQFFNVLAGDMSIVGPRPPIGYEVEMYRPWHINRIFNCKPGITGPWQIEGRSRSSFDEMVRMDIKYQKTWTLWLDIILMLKTPSVMVSKKGAY